MRLQPLYSISLILLLCGLTQAGAESEPGPEAATESQSQSQSQSQNQSQSQSQSQNQPLAEPGRTALDMKVQKFLVEVRQLLAERKFKEALAQLDEALENEENPEAKAALYMVRGNAYFLFCNYKSALADLQESLKLTPDLGEALLQKALCEARLGHEEESKADFIKLCEGKEPGLKLLGARALLEMGEMERVRVILKDLEGSANPGELKDLQKAVAEGVSRNLTVKDETTTEFSTILPGKYFVIYADFDEEKAQEYLDTADNIIDYFINRFGPVNARAPYPCGLFMLHDKLAARSFLTRKMKFGLPVHGVFMSGRNALVTYDGAGTGTFIHELMHKYLDKVKLEYWAEEGIPAAFEKIYGQNLNGSLQFCILPHNDLPKAIFKKRPVLKEVLTSARHAYSEHEEAQALVGLFLLHENKMEKYLSLIRSSKDKDQMLIYSALGMTAAQANLRFDQFISQIMGLRERILKLPPSQIVEKDKFNKFIQVNSDLIKACGSDPK